MKCKKDGLQKKKHELTAEKKMTQGHVWCPERERERETKTERGTEIAVSGVAITAVTSVQKGPGIC